MSFEAVPCMFRSTANDGNSSSYIGLLIRPSGSGATTQQQGATTTVNAAVVGGNPLNGPKSLHVVPSSLKSTTTMPNQSQKVVMPSGGVQLRLQPTTVCATTSQCNDAWIHSTQRPLVNNTFDSPSPSQVVPQMNVGDSYECSVPCASSSSFFPPISSITQNLSSAKSDIDLLQEISSVEMNVMRNPKINNTNGDYVQSTTPQQYPTNSMHNIYAAPPQAEMPLGRMPSCRYQSGYNGANDCSATPDSGIQSIAGSPPSSGPFTPPLPSPAPSIPIAAVDVGDTSTRVSTSADDFSDMPRLVPFHQLEESDSLATDEDGASHIEESSNKTSVTSEPENTNCSQTETKSTDDDDVPKIAITPAMNVNELVEQLMSHMDAEQRKQFATVIRSKVESEFYGHTKSDATSSVAVETTSDQTLKNSETFTNNYGSHEQLTESDSMKDEHHHIQQCAAPSSSLSSQSSQSTEEVNDEHSSYSGSSLMNETTTNDKHNNTSKRSSQQNDEKERKHKHRLRNGTEELHIMTSECQIEDQCETVDEQEEASSNIEQTTHIKDDNGRGRLDRQRSLQNRQQESGINGSEKQLDENQSLQQQRTSMEKSKEDISRWQKNAAATKENLKRRSEQRESLKRNEREEIINKERLRRKQEERLKRKQEEEREHLKRDDEEAERLRIKREEEEVKERLRVYRVGVKRKLNEQLKSVIEKVEKQLNNLELTFGPRMHWSMPWYRLNWKDVAQRLVERDRLEKLAKEKNAEPKKAIPRKKLRKVATTLKSDSVCSNQPSDGKDHPSMRSYIKIKHNVIVDSYPRIEQLQCSCQKGCCGESDECLNRMVQMECTSSCGRGASCSNKRISRRECVDKLSLFETDNGRGWGVRADAPIQKGQFVCEYVGEVVSMETFDTRNEHSYRSYRNHYALNLCPGFVIDAYRKGNIARFVNHSCTPNCEMQRWSVNGQHRIGLFALRSIAKGEELTYDYNWDSFDFHGVTPCSCGVPNCRGFLNKNVLMNAKEKELARTSGVLLLRNVRKSAKRKMDAARSDRKTTKSTTIPPYHKSVWKYVDDMLMPFNECESFSRKQFKQLKKSVASTMNQLNASTSFENILQSVDMHFVESFDAFRSRECDKKKVQALKALLNDIRQDHRERLQKFGTLPVRFDEHHKHKSKSSSHRIITANTNLSYLDSEVAIGSYDSDSLTHLDAAESDSDCVRCICGITDDDGSMVQCDACHFWLHEECVVAAVKHGAEFKCDICRTKATRTPAVDIVLRTQPQIKFKRCVYYRSLVNVHNIQVRINETVYLQKLANDDHKVELRRLNEASKTGDATVVPCVSHSTFARKLKLSASRFQPKAFARKDVRCFRVERLFASPEGHNFVFGFYYARPHEVYCEPGRMFHVKEVFATPMFDTLPLDAVVGRCLIVEPRVYVLGRPKMPRYDEADVYFCEYQTGKNSKYFEKIPSRNHYYINTEPHNFVRFPVPLSLNRTFTPFVMERHHNNPADNANDVSLRQKTTDSSAKRVLEQKRIRLESIIACLPSTNECYCPPRKIARHSLSSR